MSHQKYKFVNKATKKIVKQVTRKYCWECMKRVEIAVISRNICSSCLLKEELLK